MADEVGEPQVPRHEVHVVLVDGVQERVDILVDLPGVAHAADITVRIEPPDTVEVSVPHRYHLRLRVGVPITPTADSVRFKSKTGRLSMRCSIADTTAAAEAPAGGAPSPPAAVVGRPEEQQQPAEAAAAAAAAAAAQRQQQEAAADELQEQEQQRAADKQMQQQQWEQEELASAAAATAAAEAERRAWQKKQRHRLQPPPNRSAKQAAHEHQPEQGPPVPAAAPAVTAAQQAAAHHQQQDTGNAAGAGSSIADGGCTQSVAAPQGSNASPASSSAAAVGSDSSSRQPAEEQQQPVPRAAVPVEGWLPAITRGSLPESTNQFFQGVSTCLSETYDHCTMPLLAHFRALLGSPHPNNPAGWANQLWDWCCIRAFYFCLVACTWASGPSPFSVRPLALLYEWVLQGPVGIMSMVFLAVLLMWKLVVDMAWSLPIFLAGVLLPLIGADAARVHAWLQPCITVLNGREEVWTAGVKLLLTAVSFASVRGVWTLVGGPWLLGWLLAGVGGVVGWVARPAWSVLTYTWNTMVWNQKPDSLTQVLYAASTTGLCVVREYIPYCGVSLTMLQALLSGRGAGPLATRATLLLFYTVSTRIIFSAGQVPSHVCTTWWGVCVLLTSVPVLVTVWATHLGLWGVVDDVATALLYLPVTAVKLLVDMRPVLAAPLVSTGVLLFVVFKLLAVVGRTVAAGWPAVWTAVKRVCTYTGQVLTLARPGDLGLYAVIAVVGCLCGTSLREQLPPQMLGVLAAGLRFAASPVTAQLWLLAACVEACEGVLWHVLAQPAVDVLSVLLLAAIEYVVLYLLPQELVLNLQTGVCTLDVNRLAVADSIIQREVVADVEAVCRFLQTTTEAKEDLRAVPQHSWWLDLLLLAWFGFVCWCMWRCFKSSRSVPDAASSVRTKERQRLQAARQRKEAKAAERKMIRQLMRQGAL